MSPVGQLLKTLCLYGIALKFKIDPLAEISSGCSFSRHLGPIRQGESPVSIHSHASSALWRDMWLHYCAARAFVDWRLMQPCVQIYFCAGVATLLAPHGRIPLVFCGNTDHFRFLSSLRSPTLVHTCHNGILQEPFELSFLVLSCCSSLMRTKYPCD